MNILFLLIDFPDLNISSNLYTDLVEEFHKQGHNVYPVAPLQKNKKTMISKEKGINILRVKTLKLFDVNQIKKGIANILLPYQYKTAINKYYKGVHFDLIIMPTPPITLINVVKYFKIKHKCIFYLILRDIFPQNAVDLEMIKKNSCIYKIFRKQEIQLYDYADYIGCMSEGNIRYIKKHNPQLDVEKLHILMNFQKSTKTFPNKLDIKIKYGLQNKFIAVFGGNMGIPQKLENIIELAQYCQQKYENVIFLLIGEGTQQRIIENIVKKEKINNVVLKKTIPRNDFQHLISQCDIGLISLNEKFTIPNIPSKTMAYYDVGIPILACIDKHTDYGQMLIESNSGLFSIAGDIKSLIKNFSMLYNNPKLRKEMGKNGKEFLEKHMTPFTAYKTIMNYVQIH